MSSKLIEMVSLVFWGFESPKLKIILYMNINPGECQVSNMNFKHDSLIQYI